MKNMLSTCRSLSVLKFVAITLVAAMMANHSRAQETEGGIVDLKKIEANFIDNPRGSKSDGPARDWKWYEIEFEYVVNSAEKKFLDEAQFKIYVECVAGDSAPAGEESDPILLVGEATYIHIAKGKNYGVFYIHPNVVEKFGGERVISGGRKNIRVEAYVSGQLIDEIQQKKEDDPTWYAMLRKINGLVYNRDQTPWANENWHRYPPLKQRRNAE